MLVHQVGGVIGASSHAEPEDDLSLLSWVKLDGNLDGGAWIERGPELAREARASHGRRTLHGAIAAQKLGPVAGHGPRPVVRVQERDPFGELHTVGVAREERAGAGIGIGDHMGRGLRALIP